MTRRLRHPALPVLAAVVAFACTTDTLIGPHDIASLAVAPASLVLPVDDTVLIQAVATDKQGVRYIGANVTWSVADSSIATVSAEGRVITRAVGSTVVTVRAGGQTGTGMIIVTPKPTIRFSADTVTFTATANGPLPAGQSVAISNSGGGTLIGVALGAPAYTGPDSGWVAAALSSSVAPDTIALTVRKDSFPLGTYTAALPVTAPKSTNSPHPLVIRLVLSAGAPAQAVKSAGDAQSATVHTATATRPAVQVKDQYGNPVESTTVTFAVTAGNGQLTGAVVTTDAAGVAAVGSWTLDTLAKVDTLTATVAALPAAIFTATATPGAAAVIARRGPGGQTDTIDATLPIPDSVRVSDVYGNAVPGVAVAWAAGGGGSLTPGGAATNAAGMATATRVLGTVPGATADTAKAAGLSGSPVVFTVTTNPGNAVTLAKQGGDSATDTVAATLPTPYTVRVADRLNNPVPGVSVTWAATGGGSITPTSLSNGSGVASATRVLGTVAGSQGASATVSGLSGSPVAFSAVALHGAAKNLAKQGGDAQNTTVDSLVTPLPAVLVTDQFGNPVPGVGVTFALGAGGARNGAITGTTPTTDAAGVATLGSWRLGSTAGPDTVTAASAGLTGSPLTFIDFGNSGSAAIMSLAGGDAQTDTVGATLAAYSVKVTDGALNPVSGVTVSWSASGGGSITPSSITNASGIATATRVLGTTAGAQGAQATVGGLSGSPVTFSATANHGMPVLLAKSAGDGLSATVNTATATPPAVAVTDQFGNPVAGVSITFAVPVGHGSVTGASTSTAANGVAQAGSWVLDSAAGANSLSATAGISLSGNPAGFSATGVHDALSPARSTVAATTASITACQSSCSPGTTATTITVTALDQYGNAIAGAAVRDSGNPVTGNNATATGTTDGTGTFSATFFSTKAEAKTVAARIGGVAITPTAAVTVNPDLTQLLANSTVTASSPITASTGSSPSTVTVTVKDQFGNGVSGRTVTVGVSGGGNTVTQPALTTDAVGAATGSFSSTLAQVKSVTASVSGTGGGAIVASAGVTVNPAAAAKVVMVTQPANWTSGTTSGSTQPSVRLQDAFSNNVLQSGVTVSAFVSSGSGTLSGTTSALTNASGVATYSNLSITGPLTGYGSHAFTFSSSGLTSATSSVITVLVSHAYNIQGGIYTPVCNTCHVWTYASTVNQASSCASTPVLITPSSTAASHIYRKVAGTQACGGFMPPSGVNAVYSDIIGRWINQGAPNN